MNPKLEAKSWDFIRPAIHLVSGCVVLTEPWMVSNRKYPQGEAAERDSQGDGGPQLPGGESDGKGGV